MSNVSQFKTNVLLLANGDVSAALEIACRSAVHFWLETSPGYRREHPLLHLPSKKKPDAILIDGEKP